MQEVDKADQQEICDFFKFIYGQNEGFLYIASKNPQQQQQFKQTFFNYPIEVEDAAKYVVDHTLNNEVYYAPALFSKPEAKKENFKCSNCFWVEFDGNAPNDLGTIPRPSLRIQSSSDGHEHWYWKTDTTVFDSTSLEGINRSLTYALGADVSGWDASQILRPPRTRNHKRGLTTQLVEQTELTYSKGVFGSLPEPPPMVAVALPDHLPAIEDVIAKTTFTDSLWKLFKDGVVEGKRSSGLMALGYGLAELGADSDSIFALLINADMRWGKFANRADKLTRLAEIVTRAKDKYPQALEESSGIQLATTVSLERFGFLDLLNSDIQLEWVWEKYLQKEGYLLITGPSGTGKTQLSLNLSQHFCLGKDFLGEKIEGSKKIAFFSLEMGPADLKYFIQHQAQGYAEEELKSLQNNLSIFPLGEPLYLSDNSERNRVEGIIVDLGLDGIVIDSLGSLTEDELTNEKEIKNLMNWIDYIRRKYGIFIVLIHHHRKASGDNKKPNKLSDVYGSFFITRNATTVLCLWDSNGKLQGIPLKVRLAARPAPFGLVRNEHLLFNKTEITLAEQSTLTQETGSIEFTGEPIKPNGMSGSMSSI